MLIREAVQQDIEQVRALVASLQHFYLRDRNSKLPAWFESTLSIEAYEERFTGAAYKNFVYEHDQRVVAYISIKDAQHLYHLFVSEKYQGQGLSRKLWEHVKEQCPQKKYTLRSSIYAVPVYKQFGFIESGSVDEKDGIRFQAMHLSKES